MKRRIKTEIVDPRTPVKVKKPFYKRWWFGALLGVPPGRGNWLSFG